MARRKPGFDDLDEMRRDVDKLGEVLGIRPGGKSKGRTVAPKPARPEPPEKESGETHPGPGEVLKGRMRKALGLSAVALAVCLQAGHAGERAIPAPDDSLRALRVLITSEFKAGDALLAIRDQRRADSLLRNVPDRGPLLQAIRDTALAREMRTRAEFDAYWARHSAEAGHAELRGNLAAQDVDKTRIPKAYLFDSSVVVFPGWVVIRKRPR